MKKIPKIVIFGHVLIKSAHPLSGAWSLLLTHVEFTPSQGPKGFKNVLFKKSNHGSVTMMCDYEKMPFDMGTHHGP